MQRPQRIARLLTVVLAAVNSLGVPSVVLACPDLLGQLPGFSALGLVVAGPLAYVAGYSGFGVIDVSNPAAPVTLGWLDLPNGAADLALSGGYAHVVTLDGALCVIDVTTPALPFMVGEVHWGYYEGSPTAVAVEDGYAYVPGLVDFRVIDVSEPRDPEVVGRLFLSGGWDVAVSRGYAYVAVGNELDGGLSVVDVSTPSAPVEVGYYETGPLGDWWRNHGGVVVSNGYVFYAAPDVGVYVFRECGLLFTDSFESGDTSAWSATVP